jgi:NAD(P)-dependent dehydrogenase (short-subunit alcohol dehydrogenase family)
MFGSDRILTAANYDFEGKSFLITGASGGIGLSIINKLLASGASVYANSRRTIAIDHPKLKHKSGDITDEAFIGEWIGEIEAIDGIIYAAGALDPMPIRFAKKEKMMKVWDVNYFSAILLVSQLIKKRRLNKDSSCVFLSSISAQFPYIGGSMYTGSKAALEVFSKVMAMELKEKNVRCNCVAPAMVKTEMYEKGIEKGSKEQMEEHVSKYPLGLGEPEDVAQATCFLLSDAARWINGITLTMDGGFLLQGK